jgi:hypothetical protein
MNRRLLLPALALLAAGAAVTASAALLKWPPWISIESPVNPFDAAAHGAVLLVHATFREGPAQVSDLSGTAEGLSTAHAARSRSASTTSAAQIPSL